MQSSGHQKHHQRPATASSQQQPTACSRQQQYIGMTMVAESGFDAWLIAVPEPYYSRIKAMGPLTPEQKLHIISTTPSYDDVQPPTTSAPSYQHQPTVMSASGNQQHQLMLTAQHYQQQPSMMSGYQQHPAMMMASGRQQHPSMMSASSSQQQQLMLTAQRYQQQTALMSGYRQHPAMMAATGYQQQPAVLTTSSRQQPPAIVSASSYHQLPPVMSSQYYHHQSATSLASSHQQQSAMMSASSYQQLPSLMSAQRDRRQSAVMWNSGPQQQQVQLPAANHQHYRAPQQNVQSASSPPQDHNLLASTPHPLTAADLLRVNDIVQKICNQQDQLQSHHQSTLQSLAPQSSTSTQLTAGDDVQSAWARLSALSQGRSGHGRTPLDKAATKVLKTWYEANRNHPYADVKTVGRLSAETKLSASKVRRWLQNYRNKCGWNRADKGTGNHQNQQPDGQ